MNASFSGVSRGNRTQESTISAKMMTENRTAEKIVFRINTIRNIRCELVEEVVEKCAGLFCI